MSDPRSDSDVELPDADLLPDHEHADARPQGSFARAAFLIGSAGLLTATAIDSLAVLGRHTGFSVIGSIELVQIAVVMIASSAMVGATLQGAHASVHIVTERLSVPVAERLERISNLLSAITFLLLLTGSVWVATDLWAGHERTELLGIPLRWFRAIWIAAAALIIVLFAARASRRVK